MAEDNDDWSAVEALFDGAWEQPAADRQAWLDRQAAPARVREAARRLLAAAEHSGDFMETLPAVPPAEDGFVLRPGDRVGAWRVVAPLGRGGMGEVHAVERDDGHFRQRGALKRVAAADAGAWQRLERERGIVAGLEHPGIARLIDGGLHGDGWPYMVLEPVDGSPIDTWCEERGSPLVERVALVAQACDALAHAHARGVLHRDLTPANLLVDEHGRTRLIDFGIAELAGEQAAGHAVSLGYAAPEQLGQGPVSTATDTFGLAAVLYRLVSGAPPHDTRDRSVPGAIARIIGTPPAPLLSGPAAARWRGGADHRLLADVDAICRRALQADPERRYRSADELRDELQRALDGDAVLARSGERGYRARRWLRRHRWQASALAAGVASLAIGLGVALVHAAEASRQRDVALREQARLEAVQQAVFVMFGDASERGGREATAAAVLDGAARRIVEGYERDPAAGAPVLHALGELYFLVTDYAAAEPLLRRLAEADPRKVDPSLVAAGQYDLAQVRLRTGDAASAATLLAQAQAFWQTDASRWESRLVDSRLLQAQLLRQAGDGDGAITLLREALPRRIAISGAHHRETGVFHNNLGVALFAAGDLDGARSSFAAAREVWRASGLEQSPDALNTLNNWGAVEVTAGRVDAAEPLFAEAVAVRRAAYGPSAATAALLGNHGKLTLQAGDAAGALVLLEEAVAMGIEFAGEGSLHATAARAGAAEAALALGRVADAEAHADAAMRAARDSLGPTHPGMAMATIALVRVRAQQGRTPEAETLLSDAQEVITAAGPAAARLQAQVDQVRERYRLAPTPPAPGTATPSP